MKRFTKQLIVCAAFFGAVEAHAAQKIDFEKYMQSPATLGLINSGVALVTPCKTPLVFNEDFDEEDEIMYLSVSCMDKERALSAVIMQFSIFGNTLLPMRIEIPK